MLELTERENLWEPPEIGSDRIKTILEMQQEKSGEQRECLCIFQTEPYIDTFYIRFCREDVNEPEIMKRFTFHKGYSWSCDDEKMFRDVCLENEFCAYEGKRMDEIFQIYSKQQPDWHLRRYYTKPFRLLDHIYHCMKENTVKEMLYKSGLDELAMRADLLDEVNLLATKPSDLYDGVSVRSLRALNCKDGALFLSEKTGREMIKCLQKRCPDIFREKMNDAQCRYLKRLTDGELTVDEVARLYMARKNDLLQIWCRSQYEVFVQKEKHFKEIEAMKKLDPIYEDFINRECGKNWAASERANQLVYYLLNNREEYDRKIRAANRKRAYDWQERNKDYIVRYPQTIHDYCREAIYMQNCLMTYIEAMIHNDTTILFVRKASHPEKPFITIEVFEGVKSIVYDMKSDGEKTLRTICSDSGRMRGRT